MQKEKYCGREKIKKIMTNREYYAALRYRKFVCEKAGEKGVFVIYGTDNYYLSPGEKALLDAADSSLSGENDVLDRWLNETAPQTIAEKTERLKKAEEAVLQTQKKQSLEDHLVEVQIQNLRQVKEEGRLESYISSWLSGAGLNKEEKKAVYILIAKGLRSEGGM